METKGTFHQDSINWRKQQKLKTGMAWLLYGMSVYLCVTASLTLVIALCNFSLTYQSRDFLFQMVGEGPVISITESTPSTQSSSRSTTFTSTTQSLSSSNSTNFEPTHSLSTSVYTSTDYSTLVTPTPKKENPVSILNLEHNHQKTYTCAKQCNSPSVINARLILSLSGNGKINNYMLLTVSVATNENRVAKRKVAYLALNYLYKNRINDSIVDPEWENTVPSECKFKGNSTWGKC